MPGAGLLETHPDTGERIAGRTLPCWDETCRLALAAHEEFGDFPTVGWDVVLAPDGPRLLEFNTLWTPAILQMRGQMPLGLTAVPECLLAHFHGLCGPDGAGVGWAGRPVRSGS
jgi:hypothetical protein